MARRRGRVSNVYWGALILDWFKHLQDHDLSASDYRILFYLCEKMINDDNTAHIKQKTIAAELRMDKGNVSKSLKKLCQKQFIAKATDGYMINPHLFYAGNGYQNRDYLRDKFDELLPEQPRFSMNEDDYKLDVFPENHEHDDEDDDAWV